MKTGRPPLLAAQRKAQITAIRLRSSERQLVENAARAQNQNLSAWIRSTLLSAAQGNAEPEKPDATPEDSSIWPDAIHLL
jgi:hypothetical protein